MKKSGVVNVFGIKSMQDIYTLPITKLKKATQAVLDVLSVPESFPEGNPQRAIYCSRTLNLRSIKAIGYDMDYTLIHYSVDAWEGRAFAYGLDTLRQQGVPVDGLQFDPNLVIRGLIMDKEKGNLIKADRFGLVKRAMHGTRMLSWQAIREEYGREVVNLRNEGRWVFLNTLFSVSEAVMYVQLVDRLDQGAFNMGGPPMTYQSLYALVAKVTTYRGALYRTHVEGKLKAEIIQAGYLGLMGMGWRDLFDMVIVNARKPDFFNQNMSLYEVVTEDGLMRPVLDAKKAPPLRSVQRHWLQVEGDDVLYVGDHIYTDAALAKINFRWRTALIIRDQLKEMMNKKELVGDVFNQLRLARQRFVAGHNNLQSFDDEDGVNETLAQ
ncbi:uncharacterized protein HaLaN_00708, partial [Haematococcus lacustris]